MAEQGAGGESEVDHGHLIVADGAHFAQLRLTEAGERVSKTSVMVLSPSPIRAE